MSEVKYYVLLDSEDKIWGLFTDTTLLYSMFSNLKLVSPGFSGRVLQILPNTNILVKEWSTPNEIKALCGKVEESHEKHFEPPKEMRAEYIRLCEKLNIFKEDTKLFHRLISDGKLTLHEPSHSKKIPELLRDKYAILRDIIQKKVPEEDAFGYFIDRYVPNYVADMDITIDITSSSSSEEESDEED